MAAWLEVIARILYYLALPLTTLFEWLLILLAPLLHLGNYIFSGFLWPVRLLAKLEVCLPILIRVAND